MENSDKVAVVDLIHPDMGEKQITLHNGAIYETDTIEEIAKKINDCFIPLLSQARKEGAEENAKELRLLRELRDLVIAYGKNFGTPLRDGNTVDIAMKLSEIRSLSPAQVIKEFEEAGQ